MFLSKFEGCIERTDSKHQKQFFGETQHGDGFGVPMEWITMNIFLDFWQNGGHIASFWYCTCQGTVYNIMIHMCSGLIRLN